MSSRRRRTAMLAALVALAGATVAPAASSTTTATPPRQTVASGPAPISIPALWLGTPATKASLERAARRAFRSDRAVFRPLRQAETGGADPTLAAEVSSSTLGSPLPGGFIGLSFEYHALRAYLGRNPNALNPVFLALVRGLDAGQSPILRIGGDSTDQTWWPIPREIPPGGVTYALTPNWLRVAHALAIALRAKLILGVNLSADSPVLAAAEARALIGGIGRRFIDALEIGNEADVYSQFAWYKDRDGQVFFSRPPNYNVTSFISDFTHWRHAIPAIPLAGPAFAQTNWMTELPTFLAAEPQVKLVTFHRYPLRACELDSTLSDFPSIPNLLSDASSAGMAEQVAPFVTAAHRAGLPFRLDELNSASCTGRLGVSNTFTSALWALDTLFNLATVGVDGVNIHTLPGAPYEPFTFSKSGTRWSASVRPIYYGLLMFEQAFPPGAHLLSISAPSGPVKVWATQSTSGQTRVVLINKDPATAVNVRLQLPGTGTATPLTVERLTAPSLQSTDGVTLGGESFGTETTTGVLTANPHPTTIPAVLGSYTIPLPAASAVLLTR